MISRTILGQLLIFLSISGPIVSLCEASVTNEPKGTIMNSGGSWVSRAFFVLLAIQLIPGAVKVAKTYYQAITVPKTKIGIVTISGEIREGSRTVSEIQSLLANNEIKGLVLKIESPGGAPGASQAIYDVICKLRQKHGKPVIAWIENIGASGGYYIAAAADYIICTPSALVGSIGVYMARPYLKDFIEQFKARYIIMSSGKYKTAGSPFKESTPDEDAMFNAMLSEIRERFANDVFVVRGKQLENTPRELWTEGQVLNGDKAFELGLVDEIGSQITVEDRMKELANITTEIEWVKPSKKSALARFLGSEDSDDDSPYITAIVDRVCMQLGNRLGLADHTFMVRAR